MYTVQQALKITNFNQIKFRKIFKCCVRGCLPYHFPPAHLPQLAAYIKRCFARVASFCLLALFCIQLFSLSLALASLHSYLFCSTRAHFLFQCLTPLLIIRLCSYRALPSALTSSMLDTLFTSIFKQYLRNFQQNLKLNLIIELNVD